MHWDHHQCHTNWCQCQFPQIFCLQRKMMPLQQSPMPWHDIDDSTMRNDATNTLAVEQCTMQCLLSQHSAHDSAMQCHDMQCCSLWKKAKCHMPWLNKTFCSTTLYATMPWNNAAHQVAVATTTQSHPTTGGWLLKKLLNRIHFAVEFPVCLLSLLGISWGWCHPPFGWSRLIVLYNVSFLLWVVSNLGHFLKTVPV